jgi:hypothetical protein
MGNHIEINLEKILIKNIILIEALGRFPALAELMGLERGPSAS